MNKQLLYPKNYNTIFKCMEKNKCIDKTIIKKYNEMKKYNEIIKHKESKSKNDILKLSILLKELIILLNKKDILECQYKKCLFETINLAIKETEESLKLMDIVENGIRKSIEENMKKINKKTKKK